MYMTITIILLAMILWWSCKGSNNMEFFETKGGGEYIRIVSKLSQMAIQPYEGNLDTYITANKNAKIMWLFRQKRGKIRIHPPPEQIIFVFR